MHYCNVWSRIFLHGILKQMSSFFASITFVSLNGSLSGSSLKCKDKLRINWDWKIGKCIPRLAGS